MQPSELLDKRIVELGDWRGQIVAKLRQLILEADPNITAEWKWDTAVWSHNGLVCAVGAFKDNTALTFLKGAPLPYPNKLFNPGLDAKNSRLVRFYDGDKIDEPGLKDLIRAGVASIVRTRL